MKEDLTVNSGRKEYKAVMGCSSGRFFICIAFSWLVLVSCDSNKELLNTPAYDGPIRYIVNENTMMTDSGRALIKIKSLKRLDFENGNQEWPEGLNVEIFNDRGEISSTFRADYATYDDREELYHGTGNVVVKNYNTTDELNTEELFWDPAEETFFTEKFVTIMSDEELHTGQGLTAHQSFSTYTIHKPEGELTLEDEEF